jgi:hypothetical protein
MNGSNRLEIREHGICVRTSKRYYRCRYEEINDARIETQRVRTADHPFGGPKASVGIRFDLNNGSNFFLPLIANEFEAVDAIKAGLVQGRLSREPVEHYGKWAGRISGTLQKLCFVALAASITVVVIADTSDFETLSIERKMHAAFLQKTGTPVKHVSLKRVTKRTEFKRLNRMGDPGYSGFVVTKDEKKIPILVRDTGDIPIWEVQEETPDE